MRWTPVNKSKFALRLELKSIVSSSQPMKGDLREGHVHRPSARCMQPMRQLYRPVRPRRICAAHRNQRGRRLPDTSLNFPKAKRKRMSITKRSFKVGATVVSAFLQYDGKASRGASQRPFSWTKHRQSRRSLIFRAASGFLEKSWPAKASAWIGSPARAATLPPLVLPEFVEKKDFRIRCRRGFSLKEREWQSLRLGFLHS